MLAFAGPGLAVVWQSELARRIRDYHHHLLLGFVASHTIHLALVITLAATMGWAAFLAKFTWVTVFVGGFAFLLIYALAVDALAQLWPHALPSLKNRLVSFAMYFVWTIFALAYVTRIRPSDPVHAVFGLVALAGFMVSILGRRRSEYRLRHDPGTPRPRGIPAGDCSPVGSRVGHSPPGASALFQNCVQRRPGERCRRRPTADRAERLSHFHRTPVGETDCPAIPASILRMYLTRNKIPSRKK